MRYVPLRLRLLWRHYQPWPAEIGCGLALALFGVLSYLTDDVTFNVRGWVTVAACEGVGLTAMWAAFRWPVKRRADISAACSILLAYLAACTWWQIGANGREAPWIGLWLIATVSCLRDLDMSDREAADAP